MNIELLEALLDLRADHTLIRAALRGFIPELACSVANCQCPEGRTYFTRKDPHVGKGHLPWAPSADRYPILGKDGGTYTPENIRLAHLYCNRADYLDQRWSDPAERRKQAEQMRSQWGVPGFREKMAAHMAEVNRRPKSRVKSAMSGRKVTCARWNIARGKPCTCGTHTQAGQ